MVGVVIGMIAVLVIFQLYNVPRDSSAIPRRPEPPQQSGLYSAFPSAWSSATPAQALNAAATDLQWCAPPAPITGNISDMASTFLPIPVLISDGGGNANSDSFAVNYSLASTLVTAAPFAAAPARPGLSRCRVPQGFHPGDLSWAIQTPTTHRIPLRGLDRHRRERARWQRGRDHHADR